MTLVHHCRAAFATPVLNAARVPQNASFPQHTYIDGVRKAERCDANLYDTLQNIAGDRFASRTSSFTCPTRADPSVDALELSSSSRLERVAIGGATNE